MTKIDVPDDFDLTTALRQHSTTPKSERPRCPGCCELSVRTKTGKPSGTSRSDKPHYCNQCDVHFDEPVYGESPEDARPREEVGR